jgi:hypothetical protein
MPSSLSPFRNCSVWMTEVEFIIKLNIPLCFHYNYVMTVNTKNVYVLFSATCCDLILGRHQALETVQNINLIYKNRLIIQIRQILCILFQLYTICSVWWWPTVKSKHVTLKKYIHAICVDCRDVITNYYKYDLTLYKHIKNWHFYSRTQCCKCHLTLNVLTYCL